MFLFSNDKTKAGITGKVDANGSANKTASKKKNHESPSRQARNKALLELFKKQEVLVKVISGDIDNGNSIDERWNFILDQIDDPVNKRIVPHWTLLNPDGTPAYDGIRNTYDRTLRYNFHSDPTSHSRQPIGWQKRELNKYDGTNAGMEYVYDNNLYKRVWRKRDPSKLVIGQVYRGLAQPFMNNKQGKKVPNVYTKKTAMTLPPPDGQMNFFSGLKYGLVFDMNELDMCRDEHGQPRYVFGSNAYTNGLCWNGASGNRVNVTSKNVTTIEDIRKKHQNAGKGHKGSHNEILAKISRDSVKGIFCTEDSREARLKAMWLAHYVSNYLKLKIELPVLIINKCAHGNKQHCGCKNPNDVRVYEDKELLEDVQAEYLDRLSGGRANYSVDPLTAIKDLRPHWLPYIEAAGTGFNEANIARSMLEKFPRIKGRGNQVVRDSLRENQTGVSSIDGTQHELSADESIQSDAVNAFGPREVDGATSDVSEGTLQKIRDAWGDDGVNQSSATSTNFGSNVLASGFRISDKEVMDFVAAKDGVFTFIDNECRRLARVAGMVIDPITGDLVFKLNKRGEPIVKSKSAYDKFEQYAKIRARMEAIQFHYDPMNAASNKIDPLFRQKMTWCIKTCAEVAHHERNWWHKFFTFGMHMPRSWDNWKRVSFDNIAGSLDGGSGVNEYMAIHRDSLKDRTRHFDLNNGVKMNSYEGAKRSLNFL